MTIVIMIILGIVTYLIGYRSGMSDITNGLVKAQENYIQRLEERIKANEHKDTQE